MKSAGKKIVSLCCVITLLPGMVGGCRKRPADTTPDPVAVAEKQIRNTLDDFFAYVKMTRVDKISSFCADSGAASSYIQSVSDAVGSAALEAACGRIKAEITELFAQENEGTVKVKFSCCDEATVIMQALEQEGFSDSRALKSAIESAPSSEKELSLRLVKGDSWKFDADSSNRILSEMLGFLLTSGLIAPPQETSHGTPKLNISVFDSYWVDTSGNETGGYHCSGEKICLYVYTWNTYSNVDIRYEYVDASGDVLYTNDYSMKNSTDWIACSWRPSSAIPEGELFCRLYEPSGELFHTASIGIFPDGAMLPFPITWMDNGFWADENGVRVDFYPADAALIEYHTQALKFYKDLSLTYRFLDEEGKILYEGKMYVDESTDIFVFSWDRDGEAPIAVPGAEPAEETSASDGTGIGGDTSAITSAPSESAVPSESASGAGSTVATSADPLAPGETAPSVSETEHVTMMVTLEVTTSEGQPFLETQIEVRAVPAPEDVADADVVEGSIDASTQTNS